MPGRKLVQNNYWQLSSSYADKPQQPQPWLAILFYVDSYVKFHQKYHFGTLAYQRGSHHDKDICEALKSQTRQSGAPFKNTNSVSTMQLTLCRTTTNRTLDQTAETIIQTTTPTTKTRKRLTAPKISVKLPTPITSPPTQYWTHQNRKAMSQ